MGKYQEYKNQYSKEHYKRIPLDIKPSEYEEWKKAAGQLPLNTFIRQAVKEYIRHSTPEGEIDGGTL